MGMWNLCMPLYKKIECKSPYDNIHYINGIIVPILDNIVGLGSGQYLPSNHMLPRVNKMPNPFVHHYTPRLPLKPLWKG